ncbi:MAG: TonB family protein [Acidobacteria bacterium]|nr:TonB family protein [Acidobacteriota bacterium]
MRLAQVGTGLAGDMDEKSHVTEQMPQTIGRYQVQGAIGYGAMGAVYKAFDPLIKRTLAIKTIRLDIPRQSPQYKSFIERFYHEARISGTLSHPNIVTLFDIGEETGIPYLAMEYVEGETIASIVEKGMRFPPEKVINLVSQVASAVDYAHSKGVIHRDIKPSNLILFEGERVKVTDFGIAKLADAEMTASGTLLGTPSYMSPEQAMGDKLDGRSDIFSLGVCAFEMLSGEQPFPGNNVTSILYKLVHVDPIEPANLEMNGLVPQKWHEVFSKVLAKRPDDRYQTATEFVQDLEYCMGSWFGAAMADETVLDAGPVNPASGPGADADTTRSLPRLEATTPAATAAPPVEATTLLPAVGAATAPPAAAAAPAARTASAPAEEEDELPPTLQMKARPASAEPAAEVGATVVMKAGAQPAPPAKAATAPPPPAARSKKKGEAEAPAGATVVMTAPPAPAPAAAATPPPAADATLRAPAALTVKAEIPPPTVKAPVLDETVQAPRPGAPAAKTPVPKAAPPAKPAAAPPVATLPPAATPAPTPPTTLAPRPGVPAGLILGGAAFLFVLALAVVLVLYLRQRAQTARETPPPTQPVVTQPVAASPIATPEPVLGTLRVESQPAGATVTINGEFRGVTPLDLTDLPAGSYDVKAELKGYQTQSETVQISAESPRGQVSLSLSRTAPAMGVADILSTPFGATVTLDGAKVGQTPLTDFRLRVGSHQYVIAKDGYEPQAGSVRVETGKRARVDAQLRAIVKATPTPPADTVDTTKVYLNTPADVDTPAKKASGSSASYPDNAPKLRSGEAVSSSVSFVVTEAGEVTELKIVESGGRIVDEAVMAAIRAWKYSPAVKKGVKVKVRITFKQTFRAG